MARFVGLSQISPNPTSLRLGLLPPTQSSHSSGPLLAPLTQPTFADGPVWDQIVGKRSHRVCFSEGCSLEGKASMKYMTAQISTYTHDAQGLGQLHQVLAILWLLLVLQEPAQASPPGDPSSTRSGRGRHPQTPPFTPL